LNGAALLGGLVLLGVCASGALAEGGGGFFIPRNGGYEGRIGRAHVFLDSTAGGVLEVVSGQWPTWERLARAEMVFAVRTASGVAEVRQSFDRSPEIIFLEEGNERIGVRVKCRLYDAAGVYHGHGYTESWLYPSGEVYFTAAAAFEDELAHAAVEDAQLLVRVDERYGRATVAGAEPGRVELRGLSVERAYAFGDGSLPGRYVLFSGPERPPFALYWRTGKKEHFTFIQRKEPGAPTYYRWPDYLLQAYQGCKPPRALAVGSDGVRLRWAGPGAGGAAGPRAVFAALVRFAAPADVQELERLVSAEREPVALEVEGGVVHGNLGGYNDLDGAYEVRKTAEPMRITLPADPLGRTVRIKAVALRGHGAVAVSLDGEPLVPQLVAEGGIADDPLAPIREQPEGPADTALVTVRLLDRPRTVVVSEREGVQLAYQTRDRWRSFACFSTRGGPRWPLFRFSLVDGRARNTRAYGRREWALTENLLTWFSWCGYTPEQIADQLLGFEVLKNGPDEVVFRYVSTNANERVRSDYVVRVPADSPATQMNVTATFTVLQSWPYTDCQFFDVFPFRGVWPQDWWYDEVLWLAPDGRAKWMRTVERTYGGDASLETIAGGGFFALYSSRRGNMLMLTKNFDPPLPTRYVICANYIDFHMAVQFADEAGRPAPPPRGYSVRMQYDLAIWGDERQARSARAVRRAARAAGAAPRWRRGKAHQSPRRVRRRAALDVCGAPWRRCAVRTSRRR